MKALVTYFSPTGTTKDIALKLAEVLNADLFEIAPMVQYSEKDLDWRDPKSRSSVEMKNANSRPEIADKLTNIKDYNPIFIGFPIWWYKAPTIINTFLESYDWNGKTIIPFATSGGSDYGKTNDSLIKSCKHAKLLDGSLIERKAHKHKLKEWVDSLKIDKI
ncbi:MAG: NAD(P)H-dependent oxidoreductase [Malacoplasma sp.]|nr:NAD(P)H-dependent oxidoreductase [Malacoplasma sp.]